ncbi:MAG: hypothetical protein ACO1RA_16885 [Planctomycetaceae bacterium]
MRSLLGKLTLAMALLAAPSAASAQTTGIWEKLTGSKESAPPARVPAGLPPASLVGQSEMEIPFAINRAPTEQDSTSMVSVFVSWDQGKNWSHFRDVPASEGKFRFRVKQDLEFWFVTRIAADAKNKKIPPDTIPQLRVIVDTQKPKLKVTPKVNDNGRVELVWQMSDPHLEPSSLKFEYQDAMGPSNPWHAIPVNTRNTTIAGGQTFGRTNFEPELSSTTLNIRAEVSDTAGNKQIHAEQITIASRAKLVEKPTPLAQAQPSSDDVASSRWPEDNQLPVDQRPQLGTPSGLAKNSNEGNGEESLSLTGEKPSPRGSIGKGPGRLAANSSGQATEELLPPRIKPNPDIPASPFGAAGLPVPDKETKLPDLTLPRANPAEDELTSPRTPANLKPTLPGESSPEEMLPPTNIRPNETAKSPPRPSDIGPIPGNNAPESITPIPGRNEPEVIGDGSVMTPLPATESPRLTNSRRFTLDYDVESVGSEGIKEIELWGTTDNGLTWAKWGTDQDKISPMEVEVNNEATYGFRIVIVGNNGLEGNKPQRGDSADIYVGIDTTRPRCKITSAAYGTGADAGKLDIRWEASDLHLGTRCVSLAYSDRVDGNFTPIAAGLENSGRFLWQCDPRGPKQIYLQLEVRDEAGNIAVERLSDPIHVEGLVPHGKIRSLTPSAAPATGAFKTPLFR